MSKIILECQLDGISSKVDGTVSIRLSTQEVDQMSAAALFGLRGKHCKVLLSDSNITELESEMVDATPLVSGKKHKTPSQRLRSVIYRIWEQNSNEDFEVFYQNEMNKIIEHYRNKLD
jgi:hypothetical protein